MKLWMTLCAALLLATPAVAGDLQGTWIVDLKASDSVGPLLKAQGVSLVKRKAADSISVTQTYARSGDEVTLTVVSAAGTQVDTLQVDGQTRTVEGDRGPAQVQHRWDGDVLVTVQASEAATVTIRREASDDGATLTQHIVLEQPGEAKVTVDRVFRKQP